MTTAQKRREIYNKLPNELKDFVSSNENMELIESLSKKYGLDENQDFLLDIETHDTLLGLQTIDDFVVNLEKNLGLNESRVLEIVADLKEKIFNEFDKLKSTTNLQEKPEKTDIQEQGGLDKSAVSPPNHLLEDAKGNADNVVVGELGIRNKELGVAKKEVGIRNQELRQAEAKNGQQLPQPWWMKSVVKEESGINPPERLTSFSRAGNNELSNQQTTKTELPEKKLANSELEKRKKELGYDEEQIISSASLGQTARPEKESGIRNNELRQTETGNDQQPSQNFAKQNLGGQAHQTPAAQDLGGQAHQTPAAQDLGGQAHQTPAAQDLGGQAKDVIDEAYEKPSAQEWGTVVDQRLSAQSKDIKTENSWEARKARLVSDGNQKQEN
jgi:hypothetical protein